MSEGKKVIVRFPPSPTGPFHVGGVRTALFNYLFAKQNAGEFLLRIEDTDKERSNKEYEQDIKDSLDWLGLVPDNKGEEWRQSERSEIYKEKIQELIKKGSAYLAEESTQPSPEATAGKEGENRQVVRFKNPGGKIKFQDLIRGEVEMEVGDLKDFIIAKNINEPIYHLTVVVDDLLSGITHVIRGEDHISNTPRQILILEALGGERPIYAHLPLILAPDKSKLSKRKHGESVSLKFYRNQGYSKEAILNFMALIGWNPGETEQEIFSLEELIAKFDISKVQKKGAIFNVEKLDWMNREYILKEPKEEQLNKLKSYLKEEKSDEFLEKFLKIILDRIHRWGEVGNILASGEFSYLFQKPELNTEKLVWKTDDKNKTKENLEKVLEIVDNPEKIMSMAEEVGKGSILWPLRYALSGAEKSPDPFTLLDILGTEESKFRIENAIQKLQ